MPMFYFTVVEYDEGKRWLIRSQRNRFEVKLPDVHAFGAWASEHWPKPRYEAELAPTQMGPLLKWG